MPVEMTRRNPASNAEASIFDENNELTPAANIAASFLEAVNWNDVFAHSRIAEAADTEQHEGDNGTEKIHYLNGDVLSEAIDTSDLLGMFEHFANKLQETANSEKATLDQKLQFEAFAKSVPSCYEQQQNDDGKKQFVKVRDFREGDEADALLKAVLKEGATGIIESNGTYQNAGFVINEMKEPHASFLSRMRREIAGPAANRTKGRGFGRTAGSHYGHSMEAVTYRAEPADEKSVEEAVKAKQEAEKQNEAPAVDEQKNSSKHEEAKPAIAESASVAASAIKKKNKELKNNSK